MSDVFVSYQRADQPRVTALVEGLRHAGLSVWWDRDIAGGERWRQTIADHLEMARCVIVVWSHTSVGPAGEFVQDEAKRAHERGVLLPLRIDQVNEPLGFGEIQSLDLSDWRGHVTDWKFQDVVEAARALVADQSRPRPKAPGKRRRLMSAATGGLGALFALVAFLADLLGLQGIVCRWPAIQNGCATVGLGAAPTREEAAMWQARPTGDCAGLRSYLGQFPRGAFAEEASRRLQAVAIVSEEQWILAERRLPLSVRALDPSSDEPSARDEALARGKEDARQACDGFNAGEHRLVSTAPAVNAWRCVARGQGTACGFDGQAVCQVQVRKLVTREVCR